MKGWEGLGDNKGSVLIIDTRLGFLASAAMAPPNQVAPVTISHAADDSTVSFSDSTSGATIFYTQSKTNFVTPTHSGATPTGTTIKYTGGLINVVKTQYFSAIGYKSGMTDSVVSQYIAQHDAGGMAMIRPGAGFGAMAMFSVQPRTVAYTWDKAGNRTNVNDSISGSVNYTPDDINRYTQVGNGRRYDRREHQIGAYQSNVYSYESDTFLAKVVGGTGGSNTYLLYYDALGRCVKRTLNNSTTYYVYDGDKAIVETGATSATNVYGIGIDEIVFRTIGSTNYWYYQDHEGSVTHVTSGSSIIESYRYDVFGAPSIADGNGNDITQSGSAINNRFMFTGREYAQTFGIYEYRNRAYHPGLGRFMSEDPKGFAAGDYNLFRYGKNDPDDLTDPMGLAYVSPTLQNPQTRDLPPDVEQQKRELKSQIARAADPYDGAAHTFLGNAYTREASTKLASFYYRAYVPPGREKFGNRIVDKNGQPAFQWGLHQQSRRITSGRFYSEEELIESSGDITPTNNIRTTHGTRVPLVNGVLSDEVAKLQGGSDEFHGTATFQMHLFERVGVGETVVERPMTTQLTHSYNQEAGGEMEVDSRITKP